MIKSHLVRSMERYHEYYHLGFGLACFIVVALLFPDVSKVALLIVAVIGSFVPDTDHLFFIFIYGRNTTYAIAVRNFLSKHDIPGATNYVRTNHKSNNFILSHNLLTPLIFFIFYINLVNIGQITFALFCLSFAAHFIFDIIEDLLVFGHLNPNWYLKFRRS